MEIGQAADVHIPLVMQTVFDATFKRIVTWCGEKTNNFGHQGNPLFRRTWCDSGGMRKNNYENNILQAKNARLLRNLAGEVIYVSENCM
jgi:hypothetical protein